jgi:hypothetical protein
MNQEEGNTDSQFDLYFEEGFHEEEPRRCTRIKEVLFGARGNIGLLVAFSPPCSGKLYEIDDREIHLLLLSAYFAGQKFCPVQKWPMSVHIYIPLVENPELRDHIEVDEVKNIALGEIRRRVAQVRR